MVKNRLFSKVFSSGMQAVAVQVLGSAFFYLLSVYLPKDSFGIISWMNALCLLITTLLGFGLEQVVVRRVAASERSDWAAAAFLLHSVAGFAITFAILLILPNFAGERVTIRLLPWFFAAQGLVYVAVPLKQYLNAKERFTPYALIATVSNIGKIVVACWLLKCSVLNIQTVIWVLVAAATFELLALFIYVISKTTFSFKVRLNAYAKLLKEAAPQYLSVIFDMSLSRIDWILLGIITTNVVLADYSFAYRAFELARLPMLVIGPIILPRLSRLMAGNNKPDADRQALINSFARVELFFAMLIPLTLNILWQPVVGFITKGKYGDGNALQFLLLSICVPLQLFINLLWSVSFSAKKYKQVTTVTISCAIANLILNLILIPYFNGTGAAIAFLITTLLQAGLYYRLAGKHIMPVKLSPLLFLIFTAIVIYFATGYLHAYFLLRLLMAAGCYLLVAVLSKQIGKQHIQNFKAFLTR